MTNKAIKKIINNILILILLFSFFTLLTFPKIAKGELLNDSEVNKYLVDSFGKLKVPGAAVIIIDNDESRLYFYGENNKGLINGDSHFLIGAFSESMTALGVLKLIDEGKITENTKVIDLLPEFVNKNPYTSGITVKQLLSHTSGISKADGYKYTNLNQTGEKSIENTMKKISRLSIGEKDFDDSNLNYLILAAMIEKASGKAFGSYMKDEIFTPLGMTSTFAYKEDGVKAGLDKGFRSALGITYGSTLLYDDAGSPYAYISSTANDLQKYMTYLLSPKGEPILSNTVKSNINIPLYTKDFRNNYGLGINMINPGTDEAELLSNGLVGDYNSQFLLMPKKKQALAILVNKGHALESSKLENLRENMKRVFKGEIPKAIGGHLPIIEYSLALIAALTVVTFFIKLLRRKKIKEYSIGTYVFAALRIIVSIAMFPLISLILGYPFRILGDLAPDVAISLVVFSIFNLLQGLFTFYKIFFLDKNKRLFPKLPYVSQEERRRRKLEKQKEREEKKKAKQFNKDKQIQLPPPKEEVNVKDADSKNNNQNNEENSDNLSPTSLNGIISSQLPPKVFMDSNSQPKDEIKEDDFSPKLHEDKKENSVTSLTKVEEPAETLDDLRDLPIPEEYRLNSFSDETIIEEDNSTKLEEFNEVLDKEDGENELPSSYENNTNDIELDEVNPENYVYQPFVEDTRSDYISDSFYKENWQMDPPLEEMVSEISKENEDLVNNEEIETNEENEIIRRIREKLIGENGIE